MEVPFDSVKFCCLRLCGDQRVNKGVVRSRTQTGQMIVGSTRASHSDHANFRTRSSAVLASDAFSSPQVSRRSRSVFTRLRSERKISGFRRSSQKRFGNALDYSSRPQRTARRRQGGAIGMSMRLFDESVPPRSATWARGLHTAKDRTLSETDAPIWGVPLINYTVGDATVKSPLHMTIQDTPGNQTSHSPRIHISSAKPAEISKGMRDVLYQSPVPLSNALHTSPRHKESTLTPRRSSLCVPSIHVTSRGLTSATTTAREAKVISQSANNLVPPQLQNPVPNILPTFNATPSKLSSRSERDHVLASCSSTPAQQKDFPVCPSPVSYEAKTCTTKSPLGFHAMSTNNLPSPRSHLLSDTRSRSLILQNDVRLLREHTKTLDPSQITEEHQIISERIIEKEVKIPKKRITEDIIERQVVVPERRIVEEIIEESQTVQEKIVEIKKPVVLEKIVEYPEYVISEKQVDQKELILMEKLVEVPVIQIEERLVEVPKIVTKERIVEYMEPEIREVEIEKVIEKIVEVEQIQLREVPKPRFVDVPVPEYVEKTEVVDTTRYVPVPIEVDSIFEFKLPRIRPKYIEVPLPVYCPRFVEVGVPAELFTQAQSIQCQAILNEVSNLAINSSQCPVGLLDIEKLKSTCKEFEEQIDAHLEGSQICSNAVSQSWDAGSYWVSDNLTGLSTISPAAKAIGMLLLADRDHCDKQRNLGKEGSNSPVERNETAVSRTMQDKQTTMQPNNLARSSHHSDHPAEILDGPPDVEVQDASPFSAQQYDQSSTKLEEPVQQALEVIDKYCGTVTSAMITDLIAKINKTRTVPAPPEAKSSSETVPSKSSASAKSIASSGSKSEHASWYSKSNIKTASDVQDMLQKSRSVVKQECLTVQRVEMKPDAVVRGSTQNKSVTRQSISSAPISRSSTDESPLLKATSRPLQDVLRSLKGQMR